MVETKTITISSIFAAILLGSAVWIGLTDSDEQRDMTYLFEDMGYNLVTCDVNTSSHYQIAYMTNRTSSSGVTAYDPLMWNGTNYSSIGKSYVRCTEPWSYINTTNWPINISDVVSSNTTINITDENGTVEINTTIVEKEYIPRGVHILKSNGTIISKPYNNESYITMVELFEIVNNDELIFDIEE